MSNTTVLFTGRKIRALKMAWEAWMSYEEIL